MLNYMKSELYKATHSKDVYLWTAVLAGLAVLTNIILAISNSRIENFPYGMVRFPMSFLIGSPAFLMYGGMMIAMLVCKDENKNGTWKNVVAYGISREAAFLGKCMAATIIAVFCMTVILAAYFGSAVLLLEGPWNDLLTILVHEVGAVLLIAVGAEILGVLLQQIFKTDYMAMIIWAMIIVVMPQLCLMLGAGLDIEILSRIAEWLPTNFLEIEVMMNSKEYYALWDTAQGLAKCLIAGAGSIVIYTAAGLLAVRHKEV